MSRERTYEKGEEIRIRRKSKERKMLLLKNKRREAGIWKKRRMDEGGINVRKLWIKRERKAGEWRREGNKELRNGRR